MCLWEDSKRYLYLSIYLHVPMLCTGLSSPGHLRIGFWVKVTSLYVTHPKLLDIQQNNTIYVISVKDLYIDIKLTTFYLRSLFSQVKVSLARECSRRK